MTSTYVGKMNTIKPIDSHVHFWKFDDHLDYPAWFNDRPDLKQDYLPYHLGPELSAISAEGAVIVGTAHSTHSHNLEWGNMCEKNRIVMALIGNYRLDSAHLCELLDSYANKPWFVGIRSQSKITTGNSNDSSNSDRGAQELIKRKLVLDLIVDYTSIPSITIFSRRHENLPIVVNHCGCPPLYKSNFHLWERNIRELSRAPNVSVKYSSFLFHFHPTYDPIQLQRTAEVLFETFGSKRLLWGSNWPPVLVGGTYRQTFNTLVNSTPTLSFDERSDLLRHNSIRIYNFPIDSL